MHIDYRFLLVFLLFFMLFAFLFHFVWEMWQVPFYADFSNMPHRQAVRFCTVAALGDVVIALAAYSTASLAAGNFKWVLRPSAMTYFIYYAAGIVLTVILEYRATEITLRWQYSEIMPTLPILKTGLLPLLQWLVIPTLALYFAHLCQRGISRSSHQNHK